MEEKEIEEIIHSSIWTNNRPVIKVTTEKGEYISGITDDTRREYVKNILNWRKVFKKLIKEIKKYAVDQDYSNAEYRKTIKKEISKLEELKFGIINNGCEIKSEENGSQRISQPSYLYIKRATKLYRYTDDVIQHIYANPKPKNYGRFTDPKSKVSTFYLAFDKRVAKEEVAGTNSTKLIEFETIKDIRAMIVPGNLPSIKKVDLFFESRLRKFHNLVFSLKVEDSYFSKINKSMHGDRLKNGIYIVTNELFNMLREGNVIVYPSTKVCENSLLGREEKNKYFIPNVKNADLAILDDVHIDSHGQAFSEYVKPLKKNKR